MTSRRNFIMASTAAILGTAQVASAGSRPGTVTQDMPEVALDRKPAPAPRDGFALALGGGAAKAFAHIPYLESLDDLGIRPKQIAGTSMGSIIGALYASGMTGQDIRVYATDLLTRRQALVKRLLIDNGQTWSSLFNIFRPAVIEPEVLFEALFPEDMPVTFEELEIPLMITGTDFYAQSEVVMREGPLVSAIAASSALPVLLTPVRRDGRVLIDGGFVNPTPFDLLDAARYHTVAIDVTGSSFDDDQIIPSSLEVWAGSLSITQHSIVVEKLKTAPPDLFITPDVGRYNPLDFFGITAILATADAEQDAFKRQMQKLMEQNQ